MRGEAMAILRTSTTSPARLAGSTASSMAPTDMAWGVRKPFGLPTRSPVIAPLPSVGDSFTPPTLTVTWVISEPYFSMAAWTRLSSDRNHPEGDAAQDDRQDCHSDQEGLLHSGLHSPHFQLNSNAS
ncbi:MAG: hypothetical protein M5R42_15325 [Rhodocyclaceae bacterium]|nr:hypothetical protein [Rhodocyclaceae bacterium]